MTICILIAHKFGPFSALPTVEEFISRDFVVDQDFEVKPVLVSDALRAELFNNGKYAFILNGSRLPCLPPDDSFFYRIENNILGRAKIRPDEYPLQPEKPTLFTRFKRRLNALF